MENYKMEVTMKKSFILNKINLKERDLEILIGKVLFVDEENKCLDAEPIVLNGKDVEKYESLLGVIATSLNGKINRDSLSNDFIYKKDQELYSNNRKKYLDWKNRGEEKILFAVFDNIYQMYPNAIKDGIVSFYSYKGPIKVYSVGKNTEDIPLQYNSMQSVEYTYPMHQYLFYTCECGGLMNLAPQTFGLHAAGRTIGSISDNIKEVFSNMGIDENELSGPTVGWYKDTKDYIINDIKNENSYELNLRRGRKINDLKLGDNLFFNFSTQRIGFVDLSADNIKSVTYHLFNNTKECTPGNTYKIHIDNIGDFSMGHVKFPSYKKDPSDKNFTDKSLNKIKDELHDIVNSSDWKEIVNKFHEEIGGEDITYMEFNREGDDLVLCMNGLVGISDLTFVNFFPNLNPAFIVKSVPNKKEVVQYENYFPEVLFDFFKTVYRNLIIDGKKYLDQIKEEK